MSSVAMPGRPRIAIVNRSVWPEVVFTAEALLCTAERLAEQQTEVHYVGQSRYPDLDQTLAESTRGKDVRFHTVKLRSGSEARLFLRIIDALLFGMWTVVMLLRLRPRVIYVGTDPPVVVPFLCAMCAALVRAKLVYHVQDIHPEAAAVVAPLPTPVVKTLQAVDGFALRRASMVITLSDQMRDLLVSRSGVPKHRIIILDNPGVAQVASEVPKSTRKIVFCGNAGRLQRIPLMMKAIEKFVADGGDLTFEFVGGGVYLESLRGLEKLDAVKVHGPLPSKQSAEILASAAWALLPIEDEVLKFAFPSKTSSYVLSGNSIIAVCGGESAVAQWVKTYNCGVVVAPNINSIVEVFRAIERNELTPGSRQSDDIMGKLTLENFSQMLSEQLLSCVPERR